MRRFLFLSCTTLLISACSYLHPYHSPVQQGNIINTHKVAALKVGMTKQEVIALMGAPILRNPFDDHQSSYVYTLKPNRGQSRYQQVIVTFSNGQVSGIQKS